MIGRVTRSLRPALLRVVSVVRRYFTEQDPTFRVAFGPAFVIAVIVFVRSPASNYIFDEQEALLANPYVNGKGVGFFQVLERDFWGLPPDRSIGSYRPIPNVIWRAIWSVHPVFEHPWVHHVVNVLIHATNSALVAAIALRWTQSRGVGWLSGAAFLTCAVLTEAITGVVGLADVLGGLGVLLAVVALALPLWAMPFAAFAALSLGFFSKESTLVALPLLPWAAIVTAPLLHAARPLGWARALGAFAAAAAALVAYTETRRHFFPVAAPPLDVHDGAGALEVAFRSFLRWFSQPRLPQDPINNPLVEADVAHRVSGALGVYAEGVGQALFPLRLSGDYSFPEQPVPDATVTPASVAGALLMLVPVLAAITLWGVAIVLTRREKRRGASDASHAVRSLSLCAVSLAWFPVAYFPHSNIVFLLPTVRAERFWYVPAIGIAWLVGYALWRVSHALRGRGFARLGTAVAAAFLFFQAARARAHALDYTNDLVFWRATARSSPNSAKAHLNYGVMLGARGYLTERLEENRRALELAPKWPMASVYYADTLCRLKRADEAWPHYVRGFELSPNDRNLIALGLQCLWDQRAIAPHENQLLALAHKHAGTWLAHLARDILTNGERHNGVDPKHRPRGYDEGPKD